MRIVYAGTPEFAVPALNALRLQGHDIVAVYTQPDRPAGRGHALKSSAVKACAQALGLAVEQPMHFGDDAVMAKLRAYQPEVMIVAAYGLILPQAVLDIPTFGCINIHASLLPRWRGAAPIQRAILAGDSHTGVTIMRMAAGLDTGAMLLSDAIVIDAHDTAQTLHDRLAPLGARLLLKVLTDLPQYLRNAVEQPDDGVTYAHKLHKEEAALDWSRSAQELDRQVRAFNPWPVAQTQWGNETLRIWSAIAMDGAHPHPPGTVIKVDARGIHVACGQGVLCITELQQAARKRLAAAEFIKAHDVSHTRLSPIA